jgi:hypothetical protein
MRSNLERMNRDIGYIKKIIKEKEEKEKFDVVETKDDIPSQRGWFY